MKKEKMIIKKFLIIWGIIFFIFYICCKTVLVFCIDLFSNNTDNIIYNEAETYNVKQKNILDYFTSSDKHIKFENIFNDFEQGDISDDFEYYLSNSGDSSLIIAKGKSVLYQLKNYNSENIFSELNNSPIYISSSMRNYIIEKYSIKNDADLIKLVIKERNKINILTSTIRIKEEYLFEYIENMVYLSSDIIFFNGDISGYIVINNSDYYITLFNNNQNYYITLHNIDSFNKDNVIEFISTIKITK